MSVPSRAEACALLLRFDPPRWLLDHSAVVAEVAAFLGTRIAARGRSIDRRLVAAAALLHDLDKALPKSERPPLEHGRAGAAWLADHGHPELSAPVADHPVTRLTDDEAFYTTWWREASLEDRVVAYADKRALQRLVPLDARFAEWGRRYPANERRQRIGRERAGALERAVCQAAGVRPADVRRLRWVGRATARARG